MSPAWSVGERVERALRLLDWLAAEAPGLDPMHVALRVDEVREVLLPVVASRTEAEQVSDPSARAGHPE